MVLRREDRPMSQPKFTRQMTVAEFDLLFPTDEACKAYLTARRWPDGVVKCPRCGHDKVWTLHARPFHWLCRNCSEQGYRFSVLVETMFEDTKIGLRDWFRVIHMMLTSKKGVAALEVLRVMGFGSYRTAHYMWHRIRAGRGGGSGCARVLRNTDAPTLQGFVREAVSTKVALLASDEHPSYHGLTDFPHAFVQHGNAEYVVGAVHTCTIDGFWSLLKRGIMGTLDTLMKG